jgi:hypothetical protein
MFITAFSCYLVIIITYAAVVTTGKIQKNPDGGQRARASTAKRTRQLKAASQRGRALQYIKPLTVWHGQEQKKT